MRAYAAALVGIGIFFSACSERGRAAAAQSAQDTARGGASVRQRTGGDAVPVVTTRVDKKPVPVTLPAVGAAESISTVQIRPQITGQLTDIGFTEGEEVRKGQLLFTIDPRPFEAAVAQAQAELERDTAAANNQRAQQQRLESLFTRGLLARDQYEAQVATAKGAQATVEVDRAAVQTARLNLQYTRITAPIGGRTGSQGVYVGDVVRATDTTPMVVINVIAPIYVTFSVPGRYASDIRRYQRERPLTVECTVQPAIVPGAQPQAPAAAAPDVLSSPDEGRTEQGSLTFIDNAIDPATGTIKLRATFENRERVLWPGEFLRVTLDLRTEQAAIVVPLSAVQASQNGQFVYVVNDQQIADLRPVVVERQQGGELVIAQGLSGGENVVTDGQLRLTPGARVSAADRPHEAAGQ
jgi:multidrug efflux system membrane fusion protein